MARQNLRLRKAALVLQKFRGLKPSIQEIAAEYRAQGLIVVDEQSINEWILDQARDLNQDVRRAKFDDPEGRGKVQVIPLFEFDEEGQRRDYQRHVQDCSVPEAVQHLGYWNRAGRKCDRTFHEFFGIFAAILGRDTVRDSLNFELPPNPSDEPQST